MQQLLDVKIKKLHEDAVIPTYAKEGDAGLDLTATTRYFDGLGNVCYGTGLAFEIPEGYVGYIFPRSSISKININLTNSVGVIDSGYRGEVTFKFKPSLSVSVYDVGAIVPEFPNDYNIGDRIGQLIIMPYPKVSLIEVQELSDTERGDGGFGSSGV